MDQMIEEFRTDLKTKGVSNRTVNEYPLYVRAFQTFVGGDLLSVDENVVKNYLAYLRERHPKRPLVAGHIDDGGRKLTKATLKKYMSGLSAFYDFLLWNGKIARNPVSSVRKRYMKDYKAHDTSQRRQCPTIAQAKKLVESILDPKEKAVVLLLIKTGLRRHELYDLNVDAVNMENQTIRIKPTAKRSNEIVYFDKETANVLGKWLKIRERENSNNIPALFLDRFQNRLSPLAICNIVTKHATAVGLHDPNSNRLEDKLTPHSLRHYFSTRLRERGCPRDIVQILRGDVGTESIDTYLHYSAEDVKQAYLDYVPPLGI